MIWIKSAFTGLLVTFIGSFLCLVVFFNRIIGQTACKECTVGVSLPDLLRDPAAMTIYIGLFLAGSSAAYWYLRKTGALPIWRQACRRSL